MTDSQTSQETGITRAIRIAGGQAALAKLLSAGAHGTQQHVSQQAISEWSRQGYAPKRRAREISQCVAGRVAPGDLIDPTLLQIAIPGASLARPTESSNSYASESEISSLLLPTLEASNGQ